MSVIVATAYMEEAEQFDWLIAMNAGKVLATGSPAELKRDGTSRDGRGRLRRAAAGGASRRPPQARRFRRGQLRRRRAGDRRTRSDLPVSATSPPSIEVNFSIERGEIFGFVGSNGCGKTTTMKMLTGLLPASEGEALLFGKPLDAGDIAARLRVGYMSQSFSLYTELTVRQNLDLHARLFHLPAEAGESADRRPGRALRACRLISTSARSDLPLGIRQRLSLAVAIVHEPEMLILDEPTSGVDPLARDRFWELLIDLSRNQGVTIFVSTHFMNEAERCDRISLMDAGRVLATDTPAGSGQSARRRHARGRFHRLSRRGAGGRGAAPTATRALLRAMAAPIGRARPRCAQRSASARSGCSPTPFAKARAAARSDPPGFRAVRHRAADAGVRLRHLDRRQQPHLRRSRPRPEHREPRLSRGIAGLGLFHRKGRRSPIMPIWRNAAKRRRRGRHRNPARLRPRHQARAGRPGSRRLGRRRDAVPGADDPRLSAGACISFI